MSADRSAAADPSATDSRAAGRSGTDQSAVGRGAPVLYAVADGLAQVTLNRPDALNSINGAVHRGILDAMARAAADDAVRVVALRGSGRTFCAGGDLKAVAAGEDVGDPKALGRAIWDLPKPVIAAVHGYCLGQGYELAAVCDLTVAAESARFGEVEINHGWGPPLPVTPFILGLKRAKEILLLGEMIDARLALQIGLVNWVVGDDQLGSEVARIAARLTGLKADAVASNKRLVNSGYERAGFLTPP